VTAGAARDGGEIEALVTDRYLESLLALGLDDPSGGAVDAAVAGRLQPQVRRASARLRRDLPRFHPSFRFEERVALRLADLAGAMRVPQAAGGEGAVVPIGIAADAALEAADDPFDVLFDGPLDQRPDLRPLLIGGALTSAALSLAGAAYVAWRRARPATPMARAVRAVGRGRFA
jgi:hypothetical protein